MSKPAVYPPSPEFVSQARVQGMEGYRALYDEADVLMTSASAAAAIEARIIL